MNTIPYGRQKIEDADIEAVVKVLKGDFLTQGPAIADFEKSVTDFLQRVSSDPTKIFAYAVNNGTTALHLACLALGLKENDHVLVTGNSFAASANCALYCGAEVQFVDIDPNTLCMDLDQLENILKNSPKNKFKGIIAVDFAGFQMDWKRLREIANQHGAWIIQDSCHAIGATRTEKDGSVSAAGDAKYSDIAIYSFHPVKHIATGEGGMLLTRSVSLSDKIKLLRTHGITKDPSQMRKSDGGWYHEMQTLGYNGRISDILCALGTSQMNRIDANLAARRAIAQRYDESLQGLPIKIPYRDPSVENAYHLYVIHTDRRREMYDYLISQKIYVQVHYIPIYRHPYYEERYGAQSLKNCDHHYETCLSLPMYHSLTPEDQNRVIEVIRSFFKK